jgi:hypothetical protein
VHILHFSDKSLTSISHFLSVPAIWRIFIIGSFKPYCFDIVARQAAPPSVISCYFMQ